MRLLSRRIGQSFVVAEGVTITVKAIRGDRVRLAVDAPEGVRVSRWEIIEELNAAAEQALVTVGRPSLQVCTEQYPSRRGESSGPA
jgi:carbon storage regulator